VTRQALANAPYSSLEVKLVCEMTVPLAWKSLAWPVSLPNRPATEPGTSAADRVRLVLM
jgi:hypothetical protein